MGFGQGVGFGGSGSGGGGGGTPSLTATQVGFGSNANLLTSSPDFVYSQNAKVFQVGFNGTPYIIGLNGQYGLYAMGDPFVTANGTYIFGEDNHQRTAIGSVKYIEVSPAFPDVTFLGVGLNDMLNSTILYEGASAANYDITIDGTGVTDTFSWTDGTTTVNNVPITTEAAQVLNNGVSIAWGASTGHTLGDIWEFNYAVSYGRIAIFKGVVNDAQ